MLAVKFINPYGIVRSVTVVNSLIPTHNGESPSVCRSVA